MYDADEMGFSTYVRAKHIGMNPQILGTFLCIPQPANPVYPFPNPENNPNELDIVVSIIYGVECQWASVLICQYELELNYCLLNTFVSCNVELQAHKFDVTYKQTFLPYTIGTGAFVDILGCIYNAMLCIHGGAKRLSLSFGVLIEQVLNWKSCVAYTNEETMHPTIKMSSRSMEQSISQVKRQAQQLAPEEQEEEEEPAFEAQIENLETRVDVRFQQLRQQVDDRFQQMNNRYSALQGQEN
ncbi:hypothetical protein AAC387_Pa06g2289 [Persea americana]